MTRDSVPVDWEFGGRKLRLVDTAGIRKFNVKPRPGGPSSVPRGGQPSLWAASANGAFASPGSLVAAYPSQGDALPPPAGGNGENPVAQRSAEDVTAELQLEQVGGSRVALPAQRCSHSVRTSILVTIHALPVTAGGD